MTSKDLITLAVSAKFDLTDRLYSVETSITKLIHSQSFFWRLWDSISDYTMIIIAVLFIVILIIITIIAGGLIKKE